MTLYEKLRVRKTNLKDRLAKIKEENKEKTYRLNYIRLGVGV